MKIRLLEIKFYSSNIKRDNFTIHKKKLTRFHMKFGY